jgi:hypothetical protein
MLKLTDEQDEVLKAVGKGLNILVDAAIGSGKTTVIEEIFRRNPNKNILYLTFSKLLKEEAMSRLPQRRGSKTTNYHSFAYQFVRDTLPEQDISLSECMDMTARLAREGKSLGRYDIICLDEYQDLQGTMFVMLEALQEQNPSAVYVAVGDMHQKIMDWTAQNTELWVKGWLNNNKRSFVELGFSRCFRISSYLADTLGGIWDKPINGTNERFKVHYVTLKQAQELASKVAPHNLLVIGSSQGSQRTNIQKYLEMGYSSIFNKNTLYSSITSDAKTLRITSAAAAIFATYDSTKGLERDDVFLCDYNTKYFKRRLEKGIDPIILRNLFCVAASRAKRNLYIVMTQRDLKGYSVGDVTPFSVIDDLVKTSKRMPPVSDLTFNNIYAFKYKEDIDKCFEFLNVVNLETSNDFDIRANPSDAYIDYGPLVNNFQLLGFFEGFSKHKALNLYKDNIALDKATARFGDRVLDDDGLFVKLVTSLETLQFRYLYKASRYIFAPKELKKLADRLREHFTGYEDVQIYCEYKLDVYVVRGYVTVQRDDGILYDVVYKADIQKEDLMALAFKALSLNKTSARIVSTFNNGLKEVTISDVPAFLKASLKCLNKNYESLGD